MNKKKYLKTPAPEDWTYIGDQKCYYEDEENKIKYSLDLITGTMTVVGEIDESDESKK